MSRKWAVEASFAASSVLLGDHIPHHHLSAGSHAV